jgi:hypothetical protein
MNNMNDVKVGDWVVSLIAGDDLTIGKNYKVKEAYSEYINIVDDVGDENELLKGDYKLAPRKYRNPPREEYRPILEAFMAGADINYIKSHGGEFNIYILSHPANRYKVDPDSILPQPDERKERIKKQILNIDADKLAQLIIDAGIEL